jgi:hypothetical protein
VGYSGIPRQSCVDDRRGGGWVSEGGIWAVSYIHMAWKVSLLPETPTEYCECWRLSAGQLETELPHHSRFLQETIYIIHDLAGGGHVIPTAATPT